MNTKSTPIHTETIKTVTEPVSTNTLDKPLISSVISIKLSSDSSAPSKSIWTNAQTMELIELRNTRFRENVLLNEKNCSKKTKLWGQIGTILGVKHSCEKIGHKYRDLLSKFNTKKRIDNRSGESSVKWKYMYIFERYLGKYWCLYQPNKLDVGCVFPPDIIDLLDEEETLNDSGNKGVNKLSVTKREKVITKREEERKMNELQIKALNNGLKNGERDKYSGF